MKKVYIIGPYSIGNKEQNVFNMMKIANDLIEHNFCPFIPLLYHYQNLKFPQNEEIWKKLDNTWLSYCDIILRIPGKSIGGDNEVKLAKDLNKPIYYSLEELCEIYAI